MGLLDRKIFSGYVFYAAPSFLKTEKKEKCCRFTNIVPKLNELVNFLWPAIYNKKPFHKYLDIFLGICRSFRNSKKVPRYLQSVVIFRNIYSFGLALCIRHYFVQNIDEL